MFRFTGATNVPYPYSCANKRKPFFYMLLLLSISTLNIACGGNSDPIENNISPDVESVSDTTAPVIALNGDNSVFIVLGTSYADPGASASDNVDGDISEHIVVNSNLDTNAIGNYLISYQVSDQANNPAIEVLRNITVIDSQFKQRFYGARNVVSIRSGESGFDGELENGDRFGRDHSMIGDVNGDGINDLLIGARSDDDGGEDAGAVYVLFLNAQGGVSDYQKISNLFGEFSENIEAGSFFGYGVAGVGDINSDGIPDIAVSAPTLVNQSLYILHLNRDGTVIDWLKHENIAAQGLSAIGDIDNNGVIDLVAANPSSDDGGRDRGAIQLLLLNQRSHIERAITISSTQGGFGEGLNNGDQFGGRESAMLGDIDSNGTIELAVGAFMSDGGKGAIWILSLDTQNYTVQSKLKIGANQGSFLEDLPDTINENGSFGGQFGHALAYAGDLDGDGIGDIVTAANQYNEGYLYLLYLNADKTVKSFSRVNNNEGGFNLSLTDIERFGRSISFSANSNNNGDIVINTGGGAGETGAVYSLQYQACHISEFRENYYWQQEMALFSNWDHANQSVAEALSYEQCLQKSMEYQGNKITFNSSDSRCIIHSNQAELHESIEGSKSFLNACFE